MKIVIENPAILYSLVFGTLIVLGHIWRRAQMKINREILKELKEHERNQDSLSGCGF